jgi:hypothetical protein
VGNARNLSYRRASYRRASLQACATRGRAGFNFLVCPGRHTTMLGGMRWCVMVPPNRIVPEDLPASIAESVCGCNVSAECVCPESSRGHSGDHAIQRSFLQQIFIEKVNAVARAQSVDTMPFDTSHATVTSMQERLIDSDTSADELALDYPFTMTRIKRQKTEQIRPGTPRSMQEPSSMRGEPRSMREEPHPAQEYFLSSEGIGERAM